MTVGGGRTLPDWLVECAADACEDAIFDSG